MSETEMETIPPPAQSGGQRIQTLGRCKAKHVTVVDYYGAATRPPRDLKCSKCALLVIEYAVRWPAA
jgi:hypothetical protein